MVDGRVAERINVTERKRDYFDKMLRRTYTTNQLTLNEENSAVHKCSDKSDNVNDLGYKQGKEKLKYTIVFLGFTFFPHDLDSQMQQAIHNQNLTQVIS